MLLLRSLISFKRTLILRLFIVPFSFVAMFFLVPLLANSGFFVLVYVLVFIGGLLVLLVRLTSVLSLEQNSRRTKIRVIFLFIRFSLIFLLGFLPIEGVFSKFKLFYWIALSSLFLEIIFIRLLITLFFISWHFRLVKRIRRKF